MSVFFRSHQATNAILSPPESLSVALSTGVGSAGSHFSNINLPKPLGNALGVNPFAGASGAVLTQNWSEHTMTGLDRPRLLNL
jgi:hypothetical protein